MMNHNVYQRLIAQSDRFGLDVRPYVTANNWECSWRFLRSLGRKQIETNWEGRSCGYTRRASWKTTGGWATGWVRSGCMQSRFRRPGVNLYIWRQLNLTIHLCKILSFPNTLVQNSIFSEYHFLLYIYANFLSICSLTCSKFYVCDWSIKFNYLAARILPGQPILKYFLRYR